MNSKLATSGFFALAALGLTAGTVDTRRFSPVDYEPGWRAAANAAYKEAHDRFVAEEEAPWKAKEAPLVKAWDAAAKTLACRLPAMGVWEMAMALNECEPMVSVEAVDPKRDAYELVEFRPGDEVAFKVKVFNPSSKPLAAGEVQLRLPDGWFYDRETAKVGEVAPYGVSEEMTFRVKAPSVNCARRLRPINFVYRNASVESCPAVEMAWFQKAPLEASKGDFGID